MTKEVINAENLDFTPKKAKYEGGRVVGCNQHEESRLETGHTFIASVIVCIPKGSPEKAHILAAS